MVGLGHMCNLMRNLFLGGATRASWSGPHRNWRHRSIWADLDGALAAHETVILWASKFDLSREIVVSFRSDVGHDRLWKKTAAGVSKVRESLLTGRQLVSPKSKDFRKGQRCARARHRYPGTRVHGP